MIVGRQGSLDTFADGFVVPDDIGQGQDPLPDSSEDPGGGSTAVQLKVELTLEGVDNKADEVTGVQTGADGLVTDP